MADYLVIVKIKIDGKTKKTKHEFNDLNKVIEFRDAITSTFSHAKVYVYSLLR